LELSFLVNSSTLRNRFVARFISAKKYTGTGRRLVYHIKVHCTVQYGINAQALPYSIIQCTVPATGMPIVPDRYKNPLLMPYSGSGGDSPTVTRRSRIERPACRLCKSGPVHPYHFFFECNASGFPALQKLLLQSAATLQYWRILSQIDAAVRSEDRVEVLGLNAAGAALTSVFFRWFADRDGLAYTPPPLGVALGCTPLAP
jgi:hypothetical protein